MTTRLTSPSVKRRTRCSVTPSASAKVGSTEKPWKERSIGEPAEGDRAGALLADGGELDLREALRRSRSATFIAVRTMLTLNAPARPRSPVMATTIARPSAGRSSSSGSPCMPPLWRAACDMRRRIAWAYGRSDSIDVLRAAQLGRRHELHGARDLARVADRLDPPLDVPCGGHPLPRRRSGPSRPRPRRAPRPPGPRGSSMSGANWFTILSAISSSFAADSSQKSFVSRISASTSGAVSRTSRRIASFTAGTSAISTLSRCPWLAA